MPVTERSLANLKPAWTSDSAPREGGAWPGWRRALREVVGDGSELFKALAALGLGQAVQIRTPAGEPMWDEDGRPVVLIPNGAIMLGAIRELLDRSFGKPVQTVADVTPVQASERAPIALSPDDEKAVRDIARRALLATPANRAVQMTRAEPRPAELPPLSGRSETTTG